jgi:hypothetical protein
MAWFDDLEVKVKQSGAADVKISDITSFLKANDFDSTMAIAEDAGGNLTAAQIAQGLTGAQQLLAPSHAPPAATQNAQSASQIAVKASVISIPLVLAGIAVYLFMQKRGRRG